MGATASLATRALAADPGGVATTQVTVRNAGSVVDEFRLDVLGEPGAWARVEPAAMSLLPGTDGTATVTLPPPRAASTASGELPFAVRVQSREDPDGGVVEEGTLTVGSYLELT